MSVLLVTYDLRTPGQDYSGLFPALKTAPDYCHALKSVWFLYTSENPSAWLEHLSPHLDSNDHIVIIEVVGNYSGRLPKTVWAWLEKHFVYASR